MKVSISIIITYSILALSACNSSVEVQEKIDQPAADTIRIDSGMFSSALSGISLEEIGVEIKQLIGIENQPDSIPLNDTAFIDQALRRLYQGNNYQPIWLFHSRADSALAVLQPEKHGLKAEDVHLDSLFAAIGINVNTQHTKSNLSRNDWAEIDIKFSRALLWWGKVLAHGKVDPSEVNEIWNYKRKPINPPLEEQLLNAATKNRLTLFSTSLAPKSALYHHIQVNYHALDKDLDSIKWAPIRFKQITKLQPGDSNEVVPLIAHRLIDLEYLDSSKLDSAEIKIYSPHLQVAVSQFQIAHGLNPDSVIGKSTLAMLNLSHQERTDAMRCSLERLRWIDHYLQGDYVLVNAPQFKVYYFHNDSLVWHSRVVVGTTWNKTPNLTAEIERLVFNPTWTVPYSISSKEILPKLQKDSTYLVKQNMNLLDRSGNVLASTSQDYSQYNRKNFPYIIRQKPGRGNSLGLVKYHMPNPYYIFMHDTPSKRYFKKDQRTYSHGCIRLENPFELAELLLENTEDWKADTIQAILDSGKTTNYSLNQPLPIHVLYLTYYIDASGKAYTLNDVYRRDEELLRLLKN